MIIKNPSITLSQYHIPHVIGGKLLNFKHSAGEDNYRSALEQLFEAIKIAPVQVHHGNQVHGNTVGIIGKVAENKELFAGFPISQNTDGLMTNERDVAILIRMADCTPIVLYDPVNHAIAAVHSGWRGTVKKISQVAIRQMAKEYNTKAEDLVVYVGPSIDSNHYEVGAEVYSAFEIIGSREKYFKEKGQKFLLDMIQANIEILIQSGVKLENIEFSTESTFLSDNLHSAREEGENYQLNAILVQLPDQISEII